MADNNKHIDLDSEEFEDAPKALRDYAKNLKKQLDAKASELDGVRTQLASRSLADVLGSKTFKNPKRVQQDILRDGIDPLDTDAVEAWLADNSDDYAQGDGSTAAAPVASEQQQAHERMAAVTSAGASSSELSKFEMVQQLITPEMSGDDVIALYAKHGI